MRSYTTGPAVAGMGPSRFSLFRVWGMVVKLPHAIHEISRFVPVEDCPQP